MAGLYIHIPFCKKKCIYCDFYSVGSINRVGEYILALKCEFLLRKKEMGDDLLRTIYIGGGTPSLLSIDLLNNLVKAIRESVDCSTVEEFTIEVNPDDVTLEYACELRRIGINRVSIGIQSFNDNELKIINRRHDREGAIKAVELIKEAGIEDISIDLIYGLPGQTLETWEHNIEEALKLDVNHISAYSLTFEEGTRLYQMRAKGTIIECSEDDYVEMYNMLVARLQENGFEHYEISNYARNGKYSKHNKAYWDNTKYIGLGVSAHSYDGQVRRYNPNNIKGYIDKINNESIPFYVEEYIDLNSQYNDCVMTQLRTMWGLDMQRLKELFGEQYYEYCKKQIIPFIKSGAIIKDGDTIRLSEEGIVISDNIFRELFMVED